MSSSSSFVSHVPDSTLEDAYVNLFAREETREGVEGVADLSCQEYTNNTASDDRDFIVTNGKRYDVMI